MGEKKKRQNAETHDVRTYTHVKLISQPSGESSEETTTQAAVQRQDGNVVGRICWLGFFYIPFRSFGAHHALKTKESKSAIKKVGEKEKCLVFYDDSEFVIPSRGGKGGGSFSVHPVGSVQYATPHRPPFFFLEVGLNSLP